VLLTAVRLLFVDNFPTDGYIAIDTIDQICLFLTVASILSIVDVIDNIYLDRYSRSSVSVDRPLLLLDLSVLSIGRSLISIYISAIDPSLNRPSCPALFID